MRTRRAIRKMLKKGCEVRKHILGNTITIKPTGTAMIVVAREEIGAGTQFFGIKQAIRHFLKLCREAKTPPVDYDAAASDAQKHQESTAAKVSTRKKKK